MNAAKNWIETKGKQYKDRLKMVTEGANRFHVSKSTFADFVDGKIDSIYTKRRKGGPGSGPRPVAVKKPAKGLTVDELMIAHDIDTKIRNAIRKALAGLADDQNITDPEFRSNHCRVGSQGWKTISAEPEFKHSRFRIGSTLYWATPKTVQDVLERMPFQAKEV